MARAFRVQSDLCENPKLRVFLLEILHSFHLTFGAKIHFELVFLACSVVRVNADFFST